MTTTTNNDGRFGSFVAGAGEVVPRASGHSTPPAEAGGGHVVVSPPKILYGGTGSPPVTGTAVDPLSVVTPEPDTPTAVVKPSPSAWNSLGGGGPQLKAVLGIEHDAAHDDLCPPLNFSCNFSEILEFGYLVFKLFKKLFAFKFSLLVRSVFIYNIKICSGGGLSLNLGNFTYSS